MSSITIRRSPTYTTNYGTLVPDTSTAAAALTNTNTFIAACDAVEAAGGGVLVIPPGTYYVGKQDFANGTGHGYSYLGYNILEIDHCTTAVKIIAEGVKLIMVAGLKMGSFNPTTGVSAASGGTDYQANLGNFINLENNKQVEIVGPLELDGNITAMTIGQAYGSGGGIQVQSHGIRVVLNESVIVRHAYVHHCGTDGFYSWSDFDTVATPYDPRYGVLLDHCRSQYNGRQGWSIVSGSHHTAIGCDFSYTGKNGVVSSNPGAGVDVENQQDGIRDVTLINCRMFDNTGVGMLTTSSTANRNIHLMNCKVIGTTSWALWADCPEWRLDDCVIVGPCTNFYDADSANFQHAFHANRTTFSDETALSPTGIVSTTRGTIDPHYGKFTDCTFISSTTNGSPFWIDVTDFSPTANDGLITFHNCQFDLLGSNQAHRVGGYFTGVNRFNTDGTGFFQYRDGSSGLPVIMNSGTLIVNGLKFGRGHVRALTANTSINLMHSGTTWTNEGATALRTHTLGGALFGHDYTFYIQDADGMKIVAAAGDTIRIGASESAAAGFIQSTTIGDHVTIRAINSTEWVATAYAGTWTVT